MKLLIYARSWMPAVGGVEIISKSLADGLADWSKAHPEDSVEITLLTQTGSGQTDDSIFPYRVIRRPGVCEWIRQIRSADVIQLEGPSMLPLALARLLRKAVVLRHHGYQSVCPNGLLLFGPDKSVCPGHFMAGQYHKCIRCNSQELGLVGSSRGLVLTFPRRWFSRRAAVNVGVSEHVGQRIALPRTRIIWNGTPTVPPNGLSARKEHSACFAYLGRLVAEKGVPVLFRASRQLFMEGYDFRLKIVGDGPERENLERLASHLDIAARTDFTGSIAQAAMPDMLKDTTAVVMPSTWEDVSPLVAIEQMMQSRLLIVSDIGGVGEMVNGVGLKFPPGDANALAACMREALENPAYCADLAMKGQERALEKFTQDRMVAEHLRLYKELTHS